MDWSFNIMADDKKIEEEHEKELIIQDIIFKGYGTKTFKKFNKEWEFRTLDSEEHKQLWSIAMVDDDDATSWAVLKKTMLQMALVSINHIEPTENMKEQIIEKLPPKVIETLYNEYQKLDKIQVEATSDINFVKKIAQNPYSKIKFKIMSYFKKLPTDKEFMHLNDHQLMWLYENISQEELEKEKNDKMKLDYLAYYVNPELAKAVRDNEKSAEQYTTKSGNITRVKAHDEQNPYNPNEVIHYGDTTVDEDFDEKLKMFMGDDEPVTVLDDDIHKGNSSETKEDFLSRVLGAEKTIQKENDNIMKNLEKEAKEAGVNPDNLDVIMVQDDDK